MRKAGILPTEATYKTMLNVYDQLGDAADLIATFEEMAIRGYKHDQVTRNVVLDMHIKRADIPSAEATFLDMRATPEGPDQYAFQRMLAMYVLGRKKSRAEMFVKEMQEKGFRPDTSLLDQLAQLK
jgi:pentatricopeptide repeat protein